MEPRRTNPHKPSTKPVAVDKKPPQFKPRLERLEDRISPSVFGSSYHNGHGWKSW